MFYRSTFWRLGMGIAGQSPSACERMARFFADAFWRFSSRRREVVVQNLLPAVDNDRKKAEQCARTLYGEFARKLTDLWSYEGGRPLGKIFMEGSGWEYFLKAREEKKGILLLTPHLGNWEFGAPLLAEKGVKLLVITLAEPYGGLTELRQKARARWGIDTLVIGRDPFAFVEIIRRLEAGETVALLVDRPPASSAVEVTLFKRPFLASVAPAELARATGCTLLPVYLPRTDQGYEAHMLPPVSYERVELRAPLARQRLSQEIMTAFEPVIRTHLNQWFHFVPIWPHQVGKSGA